MKNAVIAFIICGAVAACSFHSEKVVERPAAPATATVVATPPPPPTTVVVPSN
jgi:hypothetical protein